MQAQAGLSRRKAVRESSGLPHVEFQLELAVQKYSSPLSIDKTGLRWFGWMPGEIRLDPARTKGVERLSLCSHVL